MKTPATQLTEKEQEVFIEHFYSLWESHIDAPVDLDTPAPWGCPWYVGSNPELVGSDLKEMAENWFRECKQEIQALVKEEKTFRS